MPSLFEQRKPYLDIISFASRLCISHCVPSIYSSVTMGRETSDSPPEDDIRIEELVFSCCICQATISDVYAITESNQRFHSGSSNEDGIVTKLWITSCSHVTCSKQLENGGTLPVTQMVFSIIDN